MKLQRERILTEITIQENERRRIATDLHDSLGPLLSAVKLNINSIDIQPEDKAILDRAGKSLDEIIGSMRQISYDLLPNTLALKGLTEAVRESEIVIIATGVAEPILHLNQVKGTTVKYIFDLAMPRNVGPEVYALDEITVFDVDQISATVNETLDKRLSEIPKVEAIVQSKAQEFFDWQERRKSRTTAPAAYEQFITQPHVITRSTHSHPRQFACFMADQCCDGRPDAAWLPMQAHSA